MAKSLRRNNKNKFTQTTTKPDRYEIFENGKVLNLIKIFSVFELAKERRIEKA
jgi:hypothetical protein